jgi:hypothetical protein
MSKKLKQAKELFTKSMRSKNWNKSLDCGPLYFKSCIGERVYCPNLAAILARKKAGSKRKNPDP